MEELVTQSSFKRFLPPNTPAVWFTGVVAVIGAVFLPIVASRLPRGPDFPSICLVCCTLSLGSMIAVWCSLLGGWKAYLLGVVALVVDGLAVIPIGGPDWMPALLPLAVAVPCCLTIELIKFLLGRFSKMQNGDEDFQEGLQFKISHLLIATTVIAVVCSIGRALSGFMSFGQPGILWILSTISVVLALNTLLCVWALLGRSMAWRLLVMIPVAIGLIVLGPFVMERPAGLNVWNLIFAVCFVATATLIGLLRLEGYRFVRKSVFAN